MKNIRLKLLMSALVAALVLPGMAQEKKKDKGSESGPEITEKKNGRKPKDKSGSNSEQNGKQSAAGVKIVISPEERVVIQDYVVKRTTPSKPGKKAKGLPPGLAKKLASGGKLPPGWEKKCVVGEIMPPEVFKVCKPLPREVVVKLPPPPPGTILVAIEGKVARILKTTHEILDVFDVPLPPPPLPRLP